MENCKGKDYEHIYSLNTNQAVSAPDSVELLVPSKQQLLPALLSCICKAELGDLSDLSASAGPQKEL